MLDAHGVGPEPLPQARATAPALAQAITTALSDPALRQRAATLGETLRREDGVGSAVRLVQRYIGGS